MIQVRRFSLRREVLPASLYDDQPYHAGDWGVVIPQALKEELREFLFDFLVFCGCPLRYLTHGVYLRIDVFLNPSMEFLNVIEINARFVDGWGTTLNLNRAAGHPVGIEGTRFPRLWHLPTDNAKYRREFNLLRRELEIAGVETREVGTSSLAKGEKVYYYGWGYPERNDQTLVVPAWGYEIEDKLKFAEFSGMWSGKCIKLPTYYSFPDWTWSEVLQAEVILKFTEKHSADQRRAGASVLYLRNVTSRNEKFLQECYERRTLVAQELTEEAKIDGKITQVVVLACGAVPITGYLLLAPRGTRSINDSAEHGPLVFE